MFLRRNCDEEDVVDDGDRLSGRSNNEHPVKVSNGTGSRTRGRRALLEKSGHCERDQTGTEKKFKILISLQITINAES